MGRWLGSSRNSARLAITDPAPSVERVGVLGRVRDLREAPELPGCVCARCLEPATGSGCGYARGLTRRTDVHVHGPRRLPVLPAIERTGDGGDLPLFDRTRPLTRAGGALCAVQFPRTIRALGHPGVERVPRRRRRSHLRSACRRRHPLDLDLTQPSSDFLKRLSVPFFCPVPTDTPFVPGAPVRTPATLTTRTLPVPSAGPYYVADHLDGEYTILKRNPNYTGPRPHAFDAIALREGIDPSVAVGQVEERIVGRDRSRLRSHSSSPPGRSADEYGDGDPSAETFAYDATPTPLTGFLAFNASRPRVLRPRRPACRSARDRPGAIGGALRASGRQTSSSHRSSPGSRTRTCTR